MNYWALGVKGVAEYTSYLTPVDGDLGKVTMIDDRVDIGSKPIRKSKSMLSGRRVNTEYLPTQVSCDGKVEAIGDLSIVLNRFSVSETFKAMVGEIAPDAVQLEPFEVVKGKQPNVQAVRYWFIPSVRLHAMHKQKTKPGFTENGFFQFDRPWSEQHIVFDANITEGRPIFATAEYPGIIFVSDAFVQAVNDAGLTGTDFQWSFPAQ
ncbi:MAG: DUF1629 domain-containing protein [Aliishimia sp.]